jgi:hypothetical protein
MTFSKRARLGGRAQLELRLMARADHAEHLGVLRARCLIDTEDAAAVRSAVRRLPPTIAFTGRCRGRTGTPSTGG